MPSLVGSEMCIRDSSRYVFPSIWMGIGTTVIPISLPSSGRIPQLPVSYTHLTLPTTERV